ncbi:glycosyltransferase involved in cell wall biosynthesis [Pedobacter sp. CAN_A7]|uniref:glycosyltransferase n=1 Tax=Pedobacter sp. CAN_A7 TaxID=2787722 RepID=UPI0018CB3FFB
MENRIKVLHIIKSLGRGGAEMLLPETLKLHDQTSYEFHYIYFLPWKNQMVKTIENAGGLVTCLPAKNNIALFFKYSKIRQYIKDHDIDLVHAHLPWAGFVSRFVHWLTGVPVLYTEHNLQERYHYITKSINRLSFNSQTLAIGVSEDVTLSIKKNIAPAIQVQTVLNGVNTVSFERTNTTDRQKIRSQYGIPDNAFVIGTVAVFRFQKRLDLWLEILSTCIQANPNIYGLIIGAGPLEAELKTKHDQLNLGNRVVFAGLQTEVKPYYEAMDVFMMSSSFEGLPIALLEAMSMECAIVATKAGGIKEVIHDSSYGLTCEVENWKELAPLCLNLLNNTEKLTALQHSARLRVIDKFSMITMVTQLESLYLKHKK